MQATHLLEALFSNLKQDELQPEQPSTGSTVQWRRRTRCRCTFCSFRSRCPRNSRYFTHQGGLRRNMLVTRRDLRTQKPKNLHEAHDIANPRP